METSNNVQMTIVSDDDRKTFLFEKLGRLALSCEQTIFNFACEKSGGQYGGGFWDFCKLDNGGWYMRPSKEETYTVADWNGATYEISNDAFGIVVCAFAFNHSSIALYEMGHEQYSEMFSKYYFLLREYYLDLPESREIYRILD